MVQQIGIPRRYLLALVMPGQRRLHMKIESDARRSAIVDAIASTARTRPLTAQDGQAVENALRARGACALVVDVAAAGHHMLILAQDDSLLWWDRQHRIEITREVGCRDTSAEKNRFDWTAPASPANVTGCR